jgi:hypothetical protein
MTRRTLAFIVFALLALGQGVIRGCQQGTLPFGQQGDLR